MSACATRSNCVGAKAPGTGGTPATPYVEVRTVTNSGSSSPTLLPPSFARAIGGSGVALGACARVIWGGATVSVTKALTISECEYNALTHNGSDVYDAPPAVPSSNWEVVIHAHYLLGSKGSVPSCKPTDATPGGFDFIRPDQDTNLARAEPVRAGSSITSGPPPVRR